MVECPRRDGEHGGFANAADVVCYALWLCLQGMRYVRKSSASGSQSQVF
ncbi:MAG: hypothetical protein OJF49_002181 [Ktedonobacterales bacterium]|nr:MAG: hypothetical protein OJF49_002181 [Ktedonobacterales bacterium]